MKIDAKFEVGLKRPAPSTAFTAARYLLDCWKIECVPAPYLVLSLNLSSLMLSILLSPPRGGSIVFTLCFINSHRSWLDSHKTWNRIEVGVNQISLSHINLYWKKISNINFCLYKVNLKVFKLSWISSSQLHNVARRRVLWVQIVPLVKITMDHWLGENGNGKIVNFVPAVSHLVMWTPKSLPQCQSQTTGGRLPGVKLLSLRFCLCLFLCLCFWLCLHTPCWAELCLLHHDSP